MIIVQQNRFKNFTRNNNVYSLSIDSKTLFLMQHRRDVKSVDKRRSSTIMHNFGAATSQCCVAQDTMQPAATTEPHEKLTSSTEKSVTLCFQRDKWT